MSQALDWGPIILLVFYIYTLIFIMVYPISTKFGMVIADTHNSVLAKVEIIRITQCG